MTHSATLDSFRLADSFLPVGTYTISYGLEQFVQEDRVNNAEDLRALLQTYLERQVGPAELVALRAAHAAGRAGDVDAVCHADRRLTAVTLAEELRNSSEQSGSRLLSLHRELTEDNVLEQYADRVDAETTPGNYAVVLGVVAGNAGIDERDACLLCCHGFVTGLVGAAQRVLSLGHTDAQRILSELQPIMSEVVRESASGAISDMTPFAPLVDVLSANHERAERRLFMS